MRPQLPVDFGNRDAEGAVRLVARGTVEYVQRNGIVLCEGLKITMTDDELVAEGTCALRDGMWVAQIDSWLD